MRHETHFRYVALADEIQENISQGVFSPGEKLPSLRKLHHQLGLSISTVHQAYIELEKRGRVEAREKSGFYVRALLKSPLAVPKQADVKSLPCKVKVNELAKTIIKDLQSDDVLQLGASVPSRELMPLKQLSRILKSIHSDTLQDQISTYDLCSGSMELREALSKRMMGSAVPITAEDIITTNGCLDAVSMCLRAVTSPGDAVLVESPAFHCFLQLLEDLNLYVVEIPGRPDKGLSPDAFKKVLSENSIKACLFNSNFQNPLGSVIRIKSKQAILNIAREHNTPIIEDDIYGDLYFSEQRPAINGPEPSQAWLKKAGCSIVPLFPNPWPRDLEPGGQHPAAFLMQWSESSSTQPSQAPPSATPWWPGLYRPGPMTGIFASIADT